MLQKVNYKMVELDLVNQDKCIFLILKLKFLIKKKLLDIKISQFMINVL